MRKSIKYILTTVSLLFVAIGCADELDIKNTNKPTFLQVYATGSDLETLASSLYNTIYAGEHSYNGTQMFMATAADNSSCSWGNQAMRDMSWEPRNFGWVNTSNYNYRETTKWLFDKSYAVINTASNILKAIDAGIDIGPDGVDNVRAQAVSKFAQGVAYGDLALSFDKAFVLSLIPEGEGTVESAVDYKTVQAEALKLLDEAIALSASGFTVPAAWLGTDVDYSSSQFIKLCNTFAARIMSYAPRNQTELAAVNWAKVKAYADAGITSDFTVINDNYNIWYHEAGDYLTFSGWGVTDMYVVHLMDPTQPQHWDDTPSFPYPPKSTSPIDDRLNTDFEYVPSNWLLTARGYYHFSNYRNKRYDDFYIQADGPRVEIMLSENDMIRAEARIYSSTPDLAGAASIINAGTRKTRGKMADVAAVKADLIKAIHHERHVEMFVTGMGLQFFEMRKLNLLQKGTPLHLPLPAQTLQTFGDPGPSYYTFGGVANADGVNTSNAGWR